MSILVCGGAGYIGSHMVEELLRHNEEVVVADDLSTGHREAVPEQVKFYCGDIRDEAFLDEVFQQEKIEAIFHFAAKSLVGESMEDPLKYFSNNTVGTEKVLEKMVQYGVDKIILSSTAATYGEPEVIPITEDAKLQPTNPYGESKLMMEKMMSWVARAKGVRYVSLRYFNVAGASTTGNIGEDHQPESHLVPILLQVPLGKREFFTIFGDDYDTPDGTCIRDYVHVVDLAKAHMAALTYLRQGEPSAIFNLGSGEGYSVAEMLRAAEKVVGAPIPVKIGERRPGDPARLVASSAKAKAILGWEPEYTSMEDIIATAWRWHKNNPNGFRK